MGVDLSSNSTARSALSVDSAPPSMKLFNETPLCLGINSYQMWVSSGTMDITAVSQCALTTGTKYWPVEHFSFVGTWFLMLQVKGSFSKTQDESSLLFHSQSASYFTCRLIQNRPYRREKKINPHSQSSLFPFRSLHLIIFCILCPIIEFIICNQSNLLVLQ